MLRSILSVFTICVAWFVGATAANACPLCLAPSRTWAETIAEADVVVWAELVSADEGSDLRRPDAWFRIVKVHRGSGAWTSTPGSIVRIREAVFGDPGDTFLLHATHHSDSTPTLNETFATADAGPTIRQVSASATTATDVADAARDSSSTTTVTFDWNLPEPACEIVWQYIVTAPAPEAGASAANASQRLKYFLSWLENEKETVAADAWGEFAKAEYEVIKAIRDDFQTEQLRRWIANADTSPERLNLYGLMLGMSGSEQDALFLRQQIGPVQADTIRFGAEGLMAGLLMLSGEQGLDFLLQTRLQSENVPVFEVMAVVQSLQFAWTHEPDLIAKERMRAALHPLLHHEEMREIVIIDLARWEDWNVVHQLPELYNSVREDDPRSVGAIAGFLLTLQAPTSSATKDQRAVAATLLTQIRTDAPAVLKRVERQFR